MRNVEIQIFPIASSSTNDSSIRDWLNSVGAVSYEWPQAGASLTGAESVIGLAAKRCYMSFEPGLNPNVTKVRSDWHAYFENILKSGHGSVLEHAVYTFAIEGVSRVFTGEMNRHRAGVGISEGSMRYIRFNDIPWWLPTSLRLTDEEQALLVGVYSTARGEIAELQARIHGPASPSDMREIMDRVISTIRPESAQAAIKLALKKQKSRDIFAEVFTYCQERYVQLVDLWQLDTDTTMPFHVKKVITSCLRRIIPMGVATGGVWTMNMRAIRHILALRASEAAEEEIAMVFSMIGKYVVHREPRLMCDFAQTPEGYWVPKYPKV